MSDPNLRRDDNSSPSATGKRNEAPQSAAPNMGARSASPGAMERRPPDLEAARNFRQLSDRKSTRLNPVTNAHLVCRLLLEKKKTTNHVTTVQQLLPSTNNHS